MEHLAKKFVKYVSLNIMGMIGLSCYILADTFFVAKALGSVGLASLNFSIAVFSIIQGLGLMTGIGGATHFSIYKGRTDDQDKRNRTFVHSLVLGGFFALLFVLTAIFAATPLARLLGADDVTLPLTKVYLTTILYFSPFFILNNIVIAFVRNDDNPKLAMTAMLASSFVNIVLDYVFMFPMSMGMFGAAFATGLSPVASLCVLSGHFLRKKNHFRLCRCKIELAAVINIMSLGFSSFIGELASAITLITFNLVILGIQGNTGVAAYGIVANVALIATAVFTGVGQGVQPLASSYFGRKDASSVNRIVKYTLITAVILAVSIYGVVFCFSEPIAAVFNSQKDEILGKMAREGMKLYFTGYLFAGINIVSAAFLSAVFQSKHACLIAVLRSSALLIPGVLVLSRIFGMGGVWLSFTMTEFIVVVIAVSSLVRFKKGMESAAKE